MSDALVTVRLAGAGAGAGAGSRHCGISFTVASAISVAEMREGGGMGETRDEGGGRGEGIARVTTE